MGAEKEDDTAEAPPIPRGPGSRPHPSPPLRRHHHQDQQEEQSDQNTSSFTHQPQGVVRSPSSFRRSSKETSISSSVSSSSYRTQRTTASAGAAATAATTTTNTMTPPPRLSRCSSLSSPLPPIPPSHRQDQQVRNSRTIQPGAVAVPGIVALQRQEHINVSFPSFSNSSSSARRAAAVGVGAAARSTSYGTTTTTTTTSTTSMGAATSSDIILDNDGYDDYSVSSPSILVPLGGDESEQPMVNSNGGVGGPDMYHGFLFTPIAAEVVTEQQAQESQQQQQATISIHGSSSPATHHGEQLLSEIDIEARVQARLQEEEANIANRVKERIIREASRATVVVNNNNTMDSNDNNNNDGNNHNKRRKRRTLETHHQLEEETPLDEDDEKGIGNGRRRCSRCCICLTITLFMIIVGVILGVLFSSTIRHKIETGLGIVIIPEQDSTASSNDDDEEEDIMTNSTTTTTSPSIVPSYSDSVPAVSSPSMAPSTIFPTETATPTMSISRYDIIRSHIGMAILLQQEKEGSSSSSPNSPTEWYPISEAAINALEWLVHDDPAQLPENYNQLDEDDGATLQILVERYALAVLFFATGGASGQWLLDYHFLSSHSVCQWNHKSIRRGIFCDDSFTVVTEVILVESNLRGSLPSELSLLTHLTRLELDSNALWGSIPSLFGSQLTALEVLDLQQNYLSGTVHDSLFELPRLQTMNLNGNRKLGGTLPSSIQNATSLEDISLLGCSMSGSIPRAIEGLSTLRSIQFHDNAFTGTIPSGLMTLPNLRFLGLGKNLLTGSLSEFTVTTSLQSQLDMIDLGGNQLEGTIPSTLSSMTGLQTLNLNSNHFHGLIPTSLGELTNLQDLRLHSNFLSGYLPSFLQNTNLYGIQIGDNLLTGRIDDFLFNVPPSLSILECSSNFFSGSIPIEIGKEQFLTKLTVLAASNCQITGTLPSELSQLGKQLETLSLAMNQISGSVPTEWSQLEKLQFLDLSYNNLTGTLASSLSQLSQLRLMNVANNQLSGSLPESWASFSNHLDALELSGNNFVGDLTTTFCPLSFQDASSNSTTTSLVTRSIPEFRADCVTEVQCNCCFECCRDDTGECATNNIIINNNNNNGNGNSSSIAIQQLSWTP